MNIPKTDWHTCKICNTKISDLAKKYGGAGIYYTKVFIKHLTLDHNMNIESYCEKILKISKPICPCNICNKELDIVEDSSNFRFAKFACGRNPGVQEWAEKAKKERKGEGNPMYGKTPWNYGLTAETSDTMLATSQKMRGRKFSDEHIYKIKERHKEGKYIGKGMTGKKHSTESIQKMREGTLNNIKRGTFKHLKSAPHIKMTKILQSLNISFEEEKVVDVWSFDIYLIDYDIYLEIDGDYFHSNPKLYPNGPQTKTQKINFYRDNKKNKFCLQHNLKIIRYWEYDIINNEEDIKCRLKKLLQYDQ